MPTAMRRIFLAFGLACLALLASPNGVAAQSAGGASVNYTSVPVPAGQLTAAASLFSSTIDPDGGYNGPTYAGPTLSWTATGADGLSVDTSTSSQNPTLMANVSPPGNYPVTVTITATWAVSTGGTVSASNSITFDIAVVGVQKLQYAVNAMTSIDVPGHAAGAGGPNGGLSGHPKSRRCHLS